ncbi:hypothetical protein V6Z96_003290 [Aspergillus fumigatus]
MDVDHISAIYFGIAFHFSLGNCPTMESSTSYCSKVRNTLVLCFYSSTPTVSSLFRTAFSFFESKPGLAATSGLYVISILRLKCILFLASAFVFFGMQDDTFDFDPWVILGVTVHGLAIVRMSITEGLYYYYYFFFYSISSA